MGITVKTTPLLKSFMTYNRIITFVLSKHSLCSRMLSSNLKTNHEIQNFVLHSSNMVKCMVKECVVVGDQAVNFFMQGMEDLCFWLHYGSVFNDDLFKDLKALTTFKCKAKSWIETIHNCALQCTVVSNNVGVFHIKMNHLQYLNKMLANIALVGPWTNCTGCKPCPTQAQ